MNVKTEQKERSHESILSVAARLVRERGIAGTRVADVMNGAGLTVGGFYAHFASKTALVEEALRRNFAELRGRLFVGIDQKPATDRALVVLKRYLSAAHRDAPDAACPLPAIVGEVGTTAPEYRGVLAEHITGLQTAIEPALSGRVPRRQLALGLIALMYGGLSLARALAGTTLSDEVLKACRALGANALADS